MTAGDSNSLLWLAIVGLLVIKVMHDKYARRKDAPSEDDAPEFFDYIDPLPDDGHTVQEDPKLG